MAEAQAVAPRVLITCPWPEQAMARLHGAYRATVHDGAPLDRNQLREALREYDAICSTVTDRIDAASLDVPAPRTRILANFGAGHDHIDRRAAARAGIVVTNTPDVLTRSTAELALMLMLMAARRAGEGERELRAGKWAGWRPTHLLGTGLHGKVLGLVGFGRIGQETAKLAQASFAMPILYHSRRPHEVGLPGATYVADINDLLRASDVVSLHCPGGSETHHLIDRTQLSRFKPTAILINTSRGTVIDEAALAEALRTRQIAAAALDVYECEPTVHPGLLELENATLLPHLGSATLDARVAMGMRTIDNLDAFFAGQVPRDVVG